MDFGFQFDASKVQPAEPGGAVWEGVVPMRIDRSEKADTAAKDGSMLVIHVTAMAGKYQGQSNVIRLNLWNKSPQAVEIAGRQLSSIAHCIGVMQMNNSDQMNGKMLLGIWVKEERTVTDQNTGVPKVLESCKCNDYRLADGRTIKEMMMGTAPANPYNPNDPSPQPMPASGAPMHAPQGAPGFAQPAAAPAYQPPGPQGAPPTAPGGFAPGAPGAPAPAGTAPGFGTVASPSSPPPGAPPGYGGGGFAPPGAGQAPGGFAAPGAPPQGAPGGFGGAPQYQPQGGQPPGGFGAPQGGATGPWGQQR